MSNLTRILSSLLATLVAGAGFGVPVASGAAEGWTWTPHAEGSAIVLSVREGPGADFVTLDGGSDVGLRTGMILQVLDGREWAADLFVVGVGARHAVAMIQEISPHLPISAGATARRKSLPL